MSRTLSPAAPLLNPNVWTEVFARLEARQVETGSCDDANARQQQRELHQLKLVCKQFSAIFTSQPQLVQRLHLHSNFPANAITSLLAWQRRSNASVQVFTSSCDTSLMHTVMAGLIVSSPHLTVIDISVTTSWSIQLMAAFTSLERCALQHHGGEFQCLELTPLQGLPKLHQLYLQGKFRQLDRLPSLTSLQCKDAEIRLTPSGSYESKLQCLILENSTLQGVHAQALQACTALTELVLSAATLLDLYFSFHLTRDLARIPVGMGLLTRLCKLTLSTGTYSCRFANLESIAGITSLQDLSISFGRCCSDVIKRLTSLTNLSRLVVTGLSCDVDKFPKLTSDFDWCKLQALQTLCILRCSVELGQGVASLLQLSHLKHVSFEGSTFEGNNGNECLAALCYHFARSHPGAELVLQTRNVLKFFT